MSMGPNRRLRDTRRFRELWASGLLLREIEGELAMSDGGIRAAAKRYGYPRRQVIHNTWGRDRIAAWIAAAPEGDPEPAGDRPARATGGDGPPPLVGTHPRWTCEADVAVIRTRGRYDAIAALARRLDRPIPAVMQRWHQLRVAA